MSKLAKLPPALPRGDRAGDVSPENDKPARFNFPGGQLRQGTVCARVGSSRQTVKFPAALLAPHHKAGTAGPQTNPPQGGGQLLSLADSSLKYRPATLTAVSANSVMPCGSVDSDTLGSIGTVRDAATLPTGQAGGRYPSQCDGVKPDISDPSRVQFPARMAPVWRFLCQ